VVLVVLIRIVMWVGVSAAVCGTAASAYGDGDLRAPDVVLRGGAITNVVRHVPLLAFHVRMWRSLHLRRIMLSFANPSDERSSLLPICVAACARRASLQTRIAGRGQSIRWYVEPGT